MVNRVTAWGTLVMGAVGLLLTRADGGARGAAAVVVLLISVSTVPIAIAWFRAGARTPSWVRLNLVWSELAVTAGAFLVEEHSLGQVVGFALGLVGIFAVFYTDGRRAVVLQVAVSAVVLLGLAVACWAERPSDPAGAGARLLLGLVVVVAYPLVLSTHLDALGGVVRSQRDLARRDPLTGLLNRRGLERHAAEVGRSATAGPVSLVVLDLDGFKAVNDQHGHARGDEVLVLLARRLRDAVEGRGEAARTGGEEFALLLHGPGAPSDEAAALRSATALLDVVHHADDPVPVSASIGVARADAVVGPDDVRALLSAADAAMYRAKRAGGRRAAGAPSVPERSHPGPRAG